MTKLPLLLVPLLACATGRPTPTPRRLPTELSLPELGAEFRERARHPLEEERTQRIMEELRHRVSSGALSRGQLIEVMGPPGRIATPNVDGVIDDPRARGPHPKETTAILFFFSCDSPGCPYLYFDVSGDKILDGKWWAPLE